MKPKPSMIALVSLAASVALTSFAHASPLALSSFSRDTGIRVDQNQIQQTWQSLQTMGTTEFLGGTLGSFSLDESSMLAGALTMGATEFDNFLRSGSLGESVSGLGNILSKNMTSAAGIDLSSFTGSFTSNGGGSGALSGARLASSGGASTGGSSCAPEVASELNRLGNQYVEGMVQVAMGEDYGFSSMKQSGQPGSGFAGMTCLDKLFQISGTDIMFKPPSLGNLSSQLQNWSCGEAVSIAEQVGGAFPNGFDTSELGGFFPFNTMVEARDGGPNASEPDATSADIFGEQFAQFQRVGQDVIKESASLKNMFR